MNHGEIVSFILGVANLIRDTFRRGRYQDVILPLTVPRRLDPQLRKIAGFAFYNTSRYDFEESGHKTRSADRSRAVARTAEGDVPQSAPPASQMARPPTLPTPCG